MVQSRYEDPAPQPMGQIQSAYLPPQQRQNVAQSRYENSSAPPSQQNTPKNHYQLNERRYFEPLKRESSSSPPPVAPKPDKSNGLTQNMGDQMQHQAGAVRENKIPYLTDSLLEQQRISIERPHLKSSTKQTPPVPLPKPTREPPVPTADTKRYSSHPAGSNVGSEHHQAVTVPPEELRSQLPWSYFKNRNDISGPKRTFTHLRDDEDLPPVPVPDYTLHFPRKDRPSTNSSEEGGMYYKSKR